jgi:hypothetical protein
MIWLLIVVAVVLTWHVRGTWPLTPREKLKVLGECFDYRSRWQAEAEPDGCRAQKRNAEGFIVGKSQGRLSCWDWGYAGAQVSRAGRQLA